MDLFETARSRAQRDGGAAQASRHAEELHLRWNEKSNALPRQQPSKGEANAMARQQQTSQQAGMQTGMQNYGISEANHNTSITSAFLVAARKRLEIQP
jgi:hypothetical protein